MRTNWSFWFLLGTLPTAVFAEKNSKHMRLLKPTFAFQLCVRDTTDNEISRLKNYKGKGPDLEAKLWETVIKKCHTHLSDEAKGLMLLHYEGNSGKALGFYDGLVYSARAYVISRSIEMTGN
jgi:hypothetical protein